MFRRNDLDHFAEYTDQNKAKHPILTAVDPAYLTAIKNQAARFHIIDAFAGPGPHLPGVPAFLSTSSSLAEILAPSGGLMRRAACQSSAAEA
jgi:hypothetical protein